MRWTRLQIPSQHRADGLLIPVQPLRIVYVFGKGVCSPRGPYNAPHSEKTHIVGKGPWLWVCGKVVSGAHEGVLYFSGSPKSGLVSEPRCPELGALVSQQVWSGCGSSRVLFLRVFFSFMLHRAGPCGLWPA